jgi:hypothetical protein
MTLFLYCHIFETCIIASAWQTRVSIAAARYDPPEPRAPLAMLEGEDKNLVVVNILPPSSVRVHSIFSKCSTYRRDQP